MLFAIAHRIRCGHFGQTVLVTRSIDEAARDLFSAKVNFVSSGVIANQMDELGYKSALSSEILTGMLSRLNRNEDLMSKGIIHKFSTLAKLGNPARVERHNVSDEEPTLADLVLPGTGYKFSDEFACVLRVLGGERDFA